MAPVKGRSFRWRGRILGELISRGIRVNTVSPGPVETAPYRKLGFEKAEAKGLTGQIRLAGLGLPARSRERLCTLRRTSQRLQSVANW